MANQTAAENNSEVTAFYETFVLEDKSSSVVLDDLKASEQMSPFSPPSSSFAVALSAVVTIPALNAIFRKCHILVSYFIVIRVITLTKVKEHLGELVMKNMKTEQSMNDVGPENFNRIESFLISKKCLLPVIQWTMMMLYLLHHSGGIHSAVHGCALQGSLLRLTGLEFLLVGCVTSPA
ncbi:hypothetical protein EMCRGX_G029180 [Ephydatia muelleri]